MTSFPDGREAKLGDLELRADQLQNDTEQFQVVKQGNRERERVERDRDMGTEKEERKRQKEYRKRVGLVELELLAFQV